MQYDVNVMSGLVDESLIDEILSLVDSDQETKGATQYAEVVEGQYDGYKTEGFDDLWEISTPEEREQMLLEIEDLRRTLKSGDENDLDYRNCVRQRLNLLKHAWLVTVLERLFNLANMKWMFDIKGCSQAELLRYDDPSHKFKEHTDGDILPDGTPFTRKLTMIIQLSDPEDYEGCDLEIIEQTSEVDSRVNILETGHLKDDARKKGSVIIFPSYQQHLITPLKSGVRKSLVAWASGPSWR